MARASAAHSLRGAPLVWRIFVLNAAVFVAGTAIFGAPDPMVAAKELRAAVEP